jgi:hypothetical protein
MRARRTVCLRRLGGGHAGEVRYSRFLNSPRVTATEMLATASRHCAGRVAQRHVLAIQDTSEINYQAHAGRVRGLGPTGNGTDLGFFIHPVLAVDAEHGGIIGLAGGEVWKRPGKIAASRHARSLEDKESHRWIKAARASSETLAEAAMVTQVCDREGDIYALFAEPRAPNHHLLVRAAQDRSLLAGGQLMAHADSLPAQHRAAIEVPAKGGRPKRKATVGVGFERIELKRLQRAGAAGLPESLALSLVVVCEIDPQRGADPVRWLLLTTHAADSLPAALEIVGWYKKRWLIEQLFRTLKTNGFNIEDSQIVDGHALMNLVGVALIAAMQTLQLTMARDRATRQPVSDAFAARQVRVLAAIEQDLPGKTAKQQNPHARGTLAWAVWIIARLGGWTGYASQRPPGPKTIYLGLCQFEAINHGWFLCQEQENV